jgi:hypothetical protein
MEQSSQTARRMGHPQVHMLGGVTKSTGPSASLRAGRSACATGLERKFLVEELGVAPGERLELARRW